MIVGVANIILLIVGLLKKSPRMKVRKSLYVFIVSLVIFFMSAYGYSETMSEEQKAE